MQRPSGNPPDPFYHRVLSTLTRARVPFLVGGSFALTRYTGIARRSKDLDLFVRKDDWPRVQDALMRGGVEAHVVFPHWLGKAREGASLVDFIHSGGNGVTTVDDLWFARAPEGVLEDVAVRLVPAEEMIWSKAFVMERERYDGADVLHIVRTMHASLDWRHLLARFGPHRRVLLSHLVLFGFVYPHESDLIPRWLLTELWDALQGEVPPRDAPRLCRGTLLSREQYLTDITELEYQDARLLPLGGMTEEDAALWTAAIEGSSPLPEAFERARAHGGRRPSGRRRQPS